MGTDDLFKKRRETRKQRKHDYKTPRANSFLIVTEGENNGYHVAWSNQAFEYWLYLHFNYSDSAFHRDDWCDKLDDIFRKYELGNGTYQKNYGDIYALVNTYDGVNTAIKNAKRRLDAFRDGKDRPSEYDPGTTVYKLVQELKKFLEE